MGYRVSWIARRGTSSDELLKSIGCRLTGQRQDLPDKGFYLVNLPANGSPWVLLLALGSKYFAELHEDTARSLSTGDSEAIYFWCSDTTMASELVCYRNGSLHWSIRYDCEDSTKQPELRGQVPPTVHALLAELREQQSSDEDKDVDYIYELTANVGQSLVGFHHDMDPGTEEADPFQVLAR